MSLTTMSGLDDDVRFIRTRGYSVWEATVSGGDPGTFILNSTTVSPEDVRAFAHRLRERMQLLRLPSQHIPMVANKPKDQNMSNKYRGLSESDIRDDMRKLVAEHGSHPAAAAACGLAKSTWGNSVRGIAKIGDKVMDGLYGPTGTSLRPDVRTKPEISAPVIKPETEPVSPPAQPSGAPASDPHFEEPSTPAENILTVDHELADDSEIPPQPATIKIDDGKSEEQLEVATLLTLARSERERLVADIRKLDAQIDCLQTLARRFIPTSTRNLDKPGSLHPNIRRDSF